MKRSDGVTGIDAPELRLAEAATYLGCRPRWLKENKKAIGFALIAGKLQFRRSDLDAYKMRQYTAPVTEQPVELQRERQTRRPVPRREGISKVTGRPYGYYDRLAMGERP